jgi:hypothetical protein
LSEAHWLWVRQRVIECYKRARQPGAAVDMYRQAIKADPHDVNLRIEFASALLANEQEQAAEHELHRVLERDRSNVDARLRLAELDGLPDAAEERPGLPPDGRVEQCVADLVEVPRIKTLSDLNEGPAAVRRMQAWYRPRVEAEPSST